MKFATSLCKVCILSTTSSEHLNIYRYKEVLNTAKEMVLLVINLGSHDANYKHRNIFSMCWFVITYQKLTDQIF